MRKISVFSGLIFLALVVGSYNVLAQPARQCPAPDKSVRAEVKITSNGDVDVVPCPNRNLLLRGSLFSGGSGGSGGVANLNGLVGASQTFAFGTNGITPNWVSAGTTHTFNIPLASSSSTGLLNPTLFNLFNNKLSGSLSTTYLPRWDGTQLVNSNILDTGSALFFGVDTTISGTLSTKNFNLGNATGNGFSYFNTSKNLLSTPAATNGQILIGSTGNSPVPGNIIGTGGITVTNGAGTITISGTAGGGSGGAETPNTAVDTPTVSLTLGGTANRQISANVNISTLAGNSLTSNPSGLYVNIPSKSTVGLSSVDNTSDAQKPVSTATASALATKADLISPAFSGNPTVPTQATGNNSTRIASTAYADAAAAAVKIISVPDVVANGPPLAGRLYSESSTKRLFFAPDAANYAELRRSDTIVGVAEGGTGIPGGLTAGDLFIATGPVTVVKFPACPNGQMLVGNSAAATKWGCAAVPSGTNYAPVASSVAISGTPQQGQVLTRTYTYSDAESDPQGASTTIWQRDTDATPGGETTISGATASTYTATLTDVGNYLKSCVTPVATSGTSPGLQVCSPYTAIVTATASSGNVTWNNTQSVTIAAPNISHRGGTYYAYANSDQLLAATGAGTFRFRGKSGQAQGGLASTQVFLSPSASAPYTQPGNPPTLGLRIVVSGSTLTVYKNGTYVDDSGVISMLDTDTVQVGFDGLSHYQVQLIRSGSAIHTWTDTATTASSNYLLFWQGDTDTGTAGIDAVTYQ